MVVKYLLDYLREELTFELELQSWNLNFIEENVHITGSVTIQGMLF